MSVPAGDPSKGTHIFKQRCSDCHNTEEVSMLWSHAYKTLYKTTLNMTAGALVLGSTNFKAFSVSQSLLFNLV